MERVLLLGYSLYGGFSLREELYNLFLFFLQFFGYHSFYLMSEKETIRRIISKLQKEKAWFSGRLVTREKVLGGGFFLGQNCIGYVPLKDWCYKNGELTIITTEERYKELSDQDIVDFTPLEKEEEKEEPKEQAPKKNIIQVLDRIGRYDEIHYRKISLNISELQPIADQGSILKQIQDIYRKKKRASIFLTGPPRTGKSSVGYLLSKELGAVFTHTFNPTDPGDTFSYLFLELQEFTVDDEKPLVVVIEEVDILLEKIHTNSVTVNPKVPTLVRDKTTWSNFMDDLIFYRNVIVILTSNKSKEEIDALDPAYLRKGRVDAVLTMNTVIDCEASPQPSDPSPSLPSSELHED